MDPITIQQVASLLASIFLGSQGGGDVTNNILNQTPAGEQAVGAPPPVQQGPPIGPGANIPADGVGPIIGGQAALENAIQDAIRAGTEAGAVASPGEELQPIQAPGNKQKPTVVQKTAKKPATLEEILAAIPDALNSPTVAGLFAPPQQIEQTERPAPISGGAPGGLVGNFAEVNQPFDIGRLLASLPGIS